MPAKKKPPTKAETRQAYENARQLRVLLRDLYRGAGLDGEKHPNPYGQAKDAVNHWVETLSESHKGVLKEALQTERAAAMGETSNGISSGMQYVIEQSYWLVQKLPSWEGLPEGEQENQLGAVKALLKSKNAYVNPEKVLESIALILGAKKYEPPPPPKPKPKTVTVSMPSGLGAFVQVNPFSGMKENPETGLPQSKYHTQNVVPNQEGFFGYQVPYYMIKKGVPITWGTCEMWVDKGHDKPGQGPGETFYVHPEHATAAQKKYHKAAVDSGLLAEKLKDYPSGTYIEITPVETTDKPF